MTRFAVDHPGRVAGLIYLDAAQDWNYLDHTLDPQKQPTPP